MAKRGIKEPEGSENWPVFDRSTRKCSDDPGCVPCYWSEHGHKELSTRANFGDMKKFRENFDKIRWDKDGK